MHQPSKPNASRSIRENDFGSAGNWDMEASLALRGAHDGSSGNRAPIALAARRILRRSSGARFAEQLS
jgi:hypothetical protein